MTRFSPARWAGDVVPKEPQWSSDHLLTSLLFLAISPPLPEMFDGQNTIISDGVTVNVIWVGFL